LGGLALNKKGVMKQIFISHSSKDKPFVRRLIKDLERAGYSTWLDENEIKVGDSIPESVHNAIANSIVVLIVMSNHSTESRWVTRETNAAYMEFADNSEKRLLPVILDDCEVPNPLRDLKYADFRKSYQTGLKAVTNSLEHIKLLLRRQDLSKSQKIYLEKSKYERIEEIEREFDKWCPSSSMQDMIYLIGNLEDFLVVEDDNEIIALIKEKIKKCDDQFPSTNYSQDAWR
jgi:hypothetical protein